MVKIQLVRKMVECGMISIDGEVMPFKVYSPFAQGMHGYQGFLLVDCIVQFVNIHLMRCECDRLESLALVL